MNKAFISGVGGILSADIAVPDYDRVIKYYSRVLTTGERPFWQEDLMNNQGTPIIGIGKQPEEYSNLPLQWMPHIQVADIAQSVKNALKLGGTEVLHGKDDEGNSQWVVVLDPNGAAFGLIPVIAAEHLPSYDVEIIQSRSYGHITWLNISVKNASETRDFYQSVIGWSVKETDEKDVDGCYDDFDMCSDEGTPVAGIRSIRDENSEIPLVWQLHLPVDGLAESLNLVTEEGGKVVKRYKDPAGNLTGAIIQDPVGVSITLISE